MGYTTTFEGAVSVSPPLNEAEQAFLKRFATSRRMKREQGPYYAEPGSDYGQTGPGILAHNEPPEGQPGLWCQWVPSENGSALVWDEGEKFYEATEWMAYLIDHFLKPGCVVAELMEDGQLPEGIARRFVDFTFDHACNGEIEADGEDPDDIWLLVVDDNAVSEKQGRIVYGD